MNQPPIFAVSVDILATWLPADVELRDIRGKSKQQFVVRYRRNGVSGFQYEWDDPNLPPPHGHIILTEVRASRSPGRATLEFHGKLHVWRENAENPSPPMPLDYPLFIFDLVAVDDSETAVYSQHAFEHWPNMKRYEAEVLQRIEQRFGKVASGHPEHAGGRAQTERDEDAPKKRGPTEKTRLRAEAFRAQQ
jgi:hypothetical protein